MNKFYYVYNAKTGLLRASTDLVRAIKSSADRKIFRVDSSDVNVAALLVGLNSYMPIEQACDVFAKTWPAKSVSSVHQEWLGFKVNEAHNSFRLTKDFDELNTLDEVVVYPAFLSGLKSSLVGLCYNGYDIRDYIEDIIWA